MATILERFFDKVEMIPFHSCWEWTASKTSFGYGRMGTDCGNYKAHRLSWELHNGPIPAGLYVCHKCDNPACVRPEHLFLGTPKDNVLDRNTKGRHNMPCGLKHYRAKLTEQDIINIRSDSGSNRQLAERYGVSHHNIMFIRKRKTWKHI